MRTVILRVKLNKIWDNFKIIFEKLKEKSKKFNQAYVKFDLIESDIPFLKSLPWRKLQSNINIINLLLIYYYTLLL